MVEVLQGCISEIHEIEYKPLFEQPDFFENLVELLELCLKKKKNPKQATKTR